MRVGLPYNGKRFQQAQKKVVQQLHVKKHMHMHNDAHYTGSVVFKTTENPFESYKFPLDLIKNFCKVL